MTSPEPVERCKVKVSGRVQGVSYRYFARQAATRLGLTGGVRNLDDGRVEVEVEGTRSMIEAFLEALRAGPPLARVDELAVQWAPPEGRYQSFEIWY